MTVGATLLVLYFLSGFAALVDQIIWQRVLTFITGSDSHSVTLVVAGFMAGLGLGSLVGGFLADRLRPRARWWAFAACELAIAVFAIFSVTLFYDVLYARLGAQALGRGPAIALALVATLWPTFFMGASLPMASRMLAPGVREPAFPVTVLYGVNTLGAAAGAFAAISVLLPAMGFVAIVRLSGLINLVCGVAVCAIALRMGDGNRAPTATAPVAPSAAAPQALHGWLLAFALSGFIALALEILWFRVLGVMLRSSAFTFGHLLVLYLGGLAAGVLASATAIARRWPAAQSFFVLQALIPVYSVAALEVFLFAVNRVPFGGAVWNYLKGGENFVRLDRASPTAIVVGLVVPVVLMSVPTFLMGLSFGSLQRAVQLDVAWLGRRAGSLQAANIAGAAAGALLCGFVLLDAIGYGETLRVLVLIAAVFAYFAFQNRRFLGAALAIVTIMAATVSRDTQLWSRLHGIDDSTAIVRADGSGVAVLARADDRVWVRANGLGQSELPYGGIHTVLGALPAMLHPEPAWVAVIGLGSGDTTFAIGGAPATARIDSIEIVAPLLAALGALDAESRFPALRFLLHDSRVRHHLTDGRAFLARTASRYDIIEADALVPASAYSGALYSVEYFSLLRSRLKPGGMAVTWLPTDRVRDSLRAAFPHVAVWGEIGIGSEQPIPADVNAVRYRLQHPATVSYYRGAGLDLDQLLEPYLREGPITFGPGDIASIRADLNRDLVPRDEFGVR